MPASADDRDKTDGRNARPTGKRIDRRDARPTDEPEPPRAAPYLDPYREAVDRFGPSFEATLWRNEHWQTARFAVLCEMADLTGRVVLDAGAGRGDFARYMTEHGIEYGRYIGLDALPEMIQQARRMNLSEAEFYVCDFVADENAFSRFAGRQGVEVIVFSGSLNTIVEDFSRTVLQRAWAACREGLLFNFLSDRPAERMKTVDTTPAHRFDTLGMLDWALSHTPRVRFRQDYLDGHDATIGMWKAKG